MKRILTLTLISAVAAIFSLSTVSCSKDDDTSFNRNLLIGDWYLSYVKISMTQPGVGAQIHEFWFTEEDTQGFITFNSDGTGNFGSPTDWSLSGDQLIFTNAIESPMTFTVQKLTSTTLTIYLEEQQGDVLQTQTMTFTKLH